MARSLLASSCWPSNRALQTKPQRVSAEPRSASRAASLLVSSSSSSASAARSRVGISRHAVPESGYPGPGEQDGGIVVGDLRREQPDPRFEATGIIFTVEPPMEVLLDQERRLPGLASRQARAESHLRSSRGGEPGTCASVQARHVVGVSPFEKLPPQRVPEQMVKAIPGALGVQRRDEQVRSLER